LFTIFCHESENVHEPQTEFELNLF